MAEATLDPHSRSSLLQSSLCTNASMKHSLDMTRSKIKSGSYHMVSMCTSQSCVRMLQCSTAYIHHANKSESVLNGVIFCKNKPCAQTLNEAQPAKQEPTRADQGPVECFHIVRTGLVHKRFNEPQPAEQEPASTTGAEYSCKGIVGGICWQVVHSKSCRDVHGPGTLDKLPSRTRCQA